VFLLQYKQKTPVDKFEKEMIIINVWNKFEKEMIIINVWNMYMMYVHGGGSIGNPLSSLVRPHEGSCRAWFSQLATVAS
jgi:hypothetical protein